MDTIRAKAAALAMDRYVEKQDVWSVVALLTDFVLYGCGVALAVLGPSVWLKCVGVIVAGTATSTLFVLGHDAAHRTLFKSRRINAIAGRLLFFPCLHNHTLWLFEHNHLHHQNTNVRGINSYSPMSPKEYRDAKLWRRGLERLYRSPMGFGLYYLVERWAKHKFYRVHGIPRSMRKTALIDTAILIAWVGTLSSVLYALGASANYPHPSVAIVLGLVAPFLLWNQLVGLTVFVQHTNPHAHWLRKRELADVRVSQTELTVNIRCPRWYDILSHNVMVHPAHHVNPRIPWYRLAAAQKHLDQILGEQIIHAKMSVGFVWSLCCECQLYDYDSAQWVNFRGEPTRMNSKVHVLLSNPSLVK